MFIGCLKKFEQPIEYIFQKEVVMKKIAVVNTNLVAIFFLALFILLKSGSDTAEEARAFKTRLRDRFYQEAALLAQL